MAQLTIGSLKFSFEHLHTLKFHVTTETEPSGTDVECQRIDLEVMGVVQAAALASPDGARLPTTMVNIRDLLMRPRQPVKFEVGNQVVLVSPLPSLLAGGVPLIPTD